jgi:hypothetical protein
VSTWASLATARALWPDAPADDALLTMLLDAAQEVCEAYAPLVVAPDPVPARYGQAVVYTARDTWAARVASPEGDVFGTGFSFTPPQMRAETRQLLRPNRGPMVG